MNLSERKLAEKRKERMVSISCLDYYAHLSLTRLWKVCSKMKRSKGIGEKEVKGRDLLLDRYWCFGIAFLCVFQVFKANAFLNHVHDVFSLGWSFIIPHQLLILWFQFTELFSVGIPFWNFLFCRGIFFHYEAQDTLSNCVCVRSFSNWWPTP